MEINRCAHFQYDGATCHKTKAVKKWLDDKGFQILEPWPGNAPDLNLIENCWVMLKQKVAARNPSSLFHLKQATKEI